MKKYTKTIRKINLTDDSQHLIEEYNYKKAKEQSSKILTTTDKEEIRKYVPEVQHKLRGRMVKVPEIIYRCSGIKVLGRRLKSLLFTTDVAVISNCNANAVMAVYPFTPQLSITNAIMDSASVPVFVGVGGGLTSGVRTEQVALQAELHGAYGVVVNTPISNEMIEKLSSVLDVPVVATVVAERDDYIGKIKAGAQILNVSGGANTANLVKKIREDIGFEFPIIATGGPTDESIEKTIEAGANAITYTPPSSAEIFADVMQDYREK